MKSSLIARIRSLEAVAIKSQPKEPVTFIDENGVTMQIIGNGLVVPIELSEKEWIEMMEKHRKQEYQTRIEALENRAANRRGPIPALVFFTGLHDSKTFEEAKAEYKQMHGFDLLKNAPVLELVLSDDG